MGFNEEFIGISLDFIGFHWISLDLVEFYSDSMGYEWDLPSGKQPHNYGKIHPFVYG